LAIGVVGVEGCEGELPSSEESLPKKKEMMEVVREVFQILLQQE
jgi:hypothetical protein